MKMVKHLLMYGLALSIFPFLAFAQDIDIKNYTKSYGTGKIEGLSTSPCSSSINGGVMQPNGSMSVPQQVLDLYCSFKSCKAYIYTTKDCSGTIIATVDIDKSKGVTGITNHNIDGFYLMGSGHAVSLNGGPVKKWYNFFL